jgi:pilus assembly protein Flp/PilA
MLKKLLADENGATAIEYSLITALVSLMMINALTLVGQNLAATFDVIGNALRVSNSGF